MCKSWDKSKPVHN